MGPYTYTLPSLKLTRPPLKIGGGPQNEGSSSNHQFSGVNSLLDLERLEDYIFLLGFGNFSGAFFVSFRVPSRKRSHIPAWKRKIIDSKVP